MRNIYESDAFIGSQCGSMHPGGLRLTDRAVRLAGITAGMRIADIGCGTGATAAFLRQKYQLDIVGLDISDNLIELGLINNPGLKLLHWDGQSLPFEDASLDAVILECTLSVLGNTKKHLAQCARALKSSGSLIISDIHLKHRTEMSVTSLLTSGELAESLIAAGFNVIISEDHTSALRTYAAELRDKAAALDISCLFGSSCGLPAPRLSDLVYILTIAKKTGD